MERDSLNVIGCAVSPIIYRSRTSYYISIYFRGLHYDVEKGLFLKVDSFHQIQFGTVYRYDTLFKVVFIIIS